LLTKLSRVGCSLPGSHVFEAGCGTGFYTQLFAQYRVGRYVGLDIAPVSVENLRTRFAGFQFICADIAELDTAEIDKSFDIVFASDVLFHIVGDKQFEQSVENMSALLKRDVFLDSF